MGNYETADTGEGDQRKPLPQNPRVAREGATNQPHTGDNIIVCPNCGGIEFEFRLISNLKIKGESIVEDNAHRIHTCVKCGYNISGMADLNLRIIDVYIVGDSISGRRQGLNKIAAETNISFKMLETIKTLSEGYFNVTKAPEGPWIFTRDAWKRAKSDPNFRLAEGQYGVNVKDMN